MVEKTRRKNKCAGNVECEGECEFRINFSKVKANLCKDCAVRLYTELGKFLIPKSVKNKFNDK